MNDTLQSGSQTKSLYGVKGWLIVFVVFLPVNLIITIIQGFDFEYAVFTALTTLVFTPLIMVFLFRKKIVFRLLFVILMGVDLGFCLTNIFMRNSLADLRYYQAPLVFLIITLAKILFFTIYLFNSKRVKATYETKPKTLGGGASAFLIFMISLMVMNIISLIETSANSYSRVIIYNQIPFISNIMAYVIPIILGGLIIFFIIKRKPILRLFFIAMMLAQTVLLFHVFSYFGTGQTYGYELYSNSLAMSVFDQCIYSLVSLIAWTVIMYKSNDIRKDFGLLE